MQQPRLLSTPLFLLLVAACLVLQSWSGGRWIMYPFTLFGTWAHELGHGLMAMLVGYQFTHLELYSNLGGTAYYLSTGIALKNALVAAGGLLGPSMLGACFVLAVRRWRSPVLVLVFTALLAVLTATLWTGSAFTTIVSAVFALVLIGLIKLPWANVRDVLIQLLGIQLFITALANWDYMFTEKFSRNGVEVLSDTGSIAEALWLPYWVWGALIAAASLAILLMTLRASRL